MSCGRLDCSGTSKENTQNGLDRRDQKHSYLRRYSRRTWSHSPKSPPPIELDPNRFDHLAEYWPTESYFAWPLPVCISTQSSERRRVKDDRSLSLTLERALKARTASRRSSMRVADCRRSHRRSICRERERRVLDIRLVQLRSYRFLSDDTIVVRCRCSWRGKERTTAPEGHAARLIMSELIFTFIFEQKIKVSLWNRIDIFRQTTSTYTSRAVNGAAFLPIVCLTDRGHYWVDNWSQEEISLHTNLIAVPWFTRVAFSMVFLVHVRWSFISYWQQ